MAEAKKPDVKDKEIPTSAAQLPSIEVGARGLALKTFDDAWSMANAVAKSGMAPKGMREPHQILVAMQTGMEAGLTPMAALRSVVVINGMPKWRGRSALALIRASGKLSSFTVKWTGKPYDDDFTCHVITTRNDMPRGKNTIETSFSVKDAKEAKLWMKKGYQGGDTPWVTFPKRMLFWRALGFNADEGWSDVLEAIGGSMGIAEIAEDVPPAAASPGGEAHPPSSAPPQGEDPILAEVVDDDATGLDAKEVQGRTEPRRSSQKGKADKEPERPADPDPAPAGGGGSADEGAVDGGQGELL